MSKWKKLLSLLAGTLLILIATNIASAASSADWPKKKSIQIIVPFSAGGDSDFNARSYAKFLEKELGQTVVVVNIVGAGGSIGSLRVKEADPDGYTLLLADVGIAINEAAGLSDFGYTAFEVANICGKNPGEFITVQKDLPANTVAELIALSKKEPNKYKLAANTGATTHYVASVMRKLGAQFNVVNSGSSSERVAALAGGHINVICNAMGTIKSFVQNGDFKILANTAPKRAELFPNIPTCLEQGVDLSYDMFYSMLFPKGTDKDIIRKFNVAVKKVSEDPEYAKAIATAFGQSPLFLEGDAAIKLMKADRDRFMSFKNEFSTGK